MSEPRGNRAAPNSSHTAQDPTDTPQSLSIALLTVSDTRSLETDKSGDLLESRVLESGHRCADRQIIPDDIYRIRAVVSQWIAEASIQVIIITGGTGFGGRDSTPEAVGVLFDKTVDGFGELFRMLSYEEIGTATLQSRCLAGLANGTLVVSLPGSTGACRLAWDAMLRTQLDSTYRPCNFVSNLR